MQKSCLIFDFDNTLYAYEPAHEAALTAVKQFFYEKWQWKPEVTQKLYYESRQRIKSQLGETAASINRILYFQYMLETHQKNPIHSLTLYDLYWQNYLSHMQLRPGCEAFLEKAKQKNIKLCLLTDLVAHSQLMKIKHLKLDNYFDLVVTAEETGVLKPDKKMFLLALKKLRCDPENALMIGDSFEKDVEGALASGIDAIYFDADPSDTVKTTKLGSVKTFEELGRILLR